MATTEIHNFPGMGITGSIQHGRRECRCNPVRTSRYRGTGSSRIVEIVFTHKPL